MAPQGLRTRLEVPVSWTSAGLQKQWRKSSDSLYKQQYFTGNVKGVEITELFKLEKTSKII